MGLWNRIKGFGKVTVAGPLQIVASSPAIAGGAIIGTAGAGLRYLTAPLAIAGEKIEAKSREAKGTLAKAFWTPISAISSLITTPCIVANAVGKVGMDVGYGSVSTSLYGAGTMRDGVSNMMSGENGRYSEREGHEKEDMRASMDEWWKDTFPEVDHEEAKHKKLKEYLNKEFIGPFKAAKAYTLTILSTCALPITTAIAAVGIVARGVGAALEFIGAKEWGGKLNQLGKDTQELGLKGMALPLKEAINLREAVYQTTLKGDHDDEGRNAKDTINETITWISGNKISPPDLTPANHNKKEEITR